MVYPNLMVLFLLSIMFYIKTVKTITCLSLEYCLKITVLPKNSIVGVMESSQIYGLLVGKK